MPRLATLPFTDHFQQLPCGTRAKYVAARCRCPKCRAAACRYVQQRDALAKTAARELETRPASRPAPQLWTAPDGTKQVRLYQRACVGVNGEPCRYGSHLRKDSTGEVCMRCRPRLAAVWNGLVPADDVRAHLKKLSRQGVGYKSVAAAADVSQTSLAKILAGRRHYLRAQAARRILAVDRDAVADHAHVPAGPTWRRIRRLLAEGFTKTELARRLGSRASTPTLQIRTQLVTARTAADVERLYRIVMTI